VNLEPLLQNVTTVERVVGLGQMTPLHVHDVEEAFLVVEGRVTIHCGAATVTLEAGETFVAPAGVPHTLRAEAGPTRLRISAAVSSPARYEDFQRAIVCAHDSFTGQEAMTLAAIAAPNAIEILGPPGTLPGDLEQ
jgi:mannose-6-phosphate isomerase-like protein (cupin superfamily)